MTGECLYNRIYSEEYSSVARNKLCSSPTPIESATCPTCGPYRVQQTSSSNASSVSANGYIKGISPSPSELALPNASFNNQQLYQWDFSKFEVCSNSIIMLTIVNLTLSLCHLRRWWLSVNPYFLY